MKRLRRTYIPTFHIHTSFLKHLHIQANGWNGFDGCSMCQHRQESGFSTAEIERGVRFSVRRFVSVVFVQSNTIGEYPPVLKSNHHNIQLLGPEDFQQSRKNGSHFQLYFFDFNWLVTMVLHRTHSKLKEGWLAIKYVRGRIN